MSDSVKKAEQEQKTSESVQTKAPSSVAEQGQKTPESVQTKAPSSTEGQYIYTKAEETISSKKTTTTLGVHKTVDDTDKDTSLIHTTVKEETKGKREESSTLTVTNERYNLVSGYRAKTEEFENTTSYDRKGRVREGSYRHFQKTTGEGNGAIDISLGEKSSYSFSNETVEKYKYNKDGTIKSSQIHHEVTGSHPSVSDEYTVLNKREQVKENMRIEASRASAKVKAIKKNREFSGEFSENGPKHYFLSKGNKATEVFVDNEGKSSGARFTLDKSKENVIKKEELSPDEVTKALKKMRREADKAVEAASGKKRVQDYMSQVSEASNNSNMRFPWDVNRQAVEKAEGDVRKEQRKWVEANSGDANMVLAQIKAKGGR